jgi:anti-sigma regulatory factor (Ser/Thr protein kinase)
VVALRARTAVEAFDDDEDDSLLLGLSVLAAPEVVSPVRRFVAAALRRALRNDDLAWRMELATHELLDNASKYGQRRLVHLRITREDCQGGTALRLTLDNKSEPQHIGRLERLVTAMGDATDPMRHYLGLMKDEPPEGSLALGLARLRAEGELNLDLQVNGDRVAVSVWTELGVRS